MVCLLSDMNIISCCLVVYFLSPFLFGSLSLSVSLFVYVCVVGLCCCCVALLPGFLYAGLVHYPIVWNFRNY